MPQARPGMPSNDLDPASWHLIQQELDWIPMQKIQDRALNIIYTEKTSS